MPKYSAAVYILSANTLVREYLVKVLSDKTFELRMARENATFCSSELALNVFLLDSVSLLLPPSEIIIRIRMKLSESRFIVLDASLNATQILNLLRAGIHGFVKYSKVASTLSRAIRKVARGEFWIPSDILRTYMVGCSQGSSHRAAFDITPREGQVLTLLKRRLSNKEIADLLRIRESTVKYHVSNIFSKLQITKRNELSPIVPTGSLLQHESIVPSEPNCMATGRRAGCR
ncbi:MAG: response regulator transcription factor [Candidatus Acidiferrales bacterium]